jgi:hypothetical protein
LARASQVVAFKINCSHYPEVNGNSSSIHSFYDCFAAIGELKQRRALIPRSARWTTAMPSKQQILRYSWLRPWSTMHQAIQGNDRDPEVWTQSSPCERILILNTSLYINVVYEEEEKAALGPAVNITDKSV